MSTYYDVLGVSPSADTDECQHAYHLRAQLMHPNAHAGAPPDVIAAAVVAITELNKAWSVVRDPVARAAYDRSLNGDGSDVAEGGTAPRPRAAAPPHRPPSASECRYCGGSPAVNARVGSETGKILTRTKRRIDGPFCRDCGVATFRYMTNRTLLVGWWGIISFFANWLTIVRNVGAWWRFRSLATPQPTPSVVGITPRPLPTGRSLWRRSGVYLALGLLVVVISIAVSGGNDNPSNSNQPAALVGACLRLGSDGSMKSVVSCSRPHDAQVIESVTDATDCPYWTTDYYQSRVNGTVLCVDRSRRRDG